MQWLQDKKNLPIVIGAVAVIIIAAGIFLFMQMKGSSGGDTATAPTDPAAMAGQPGMPGAPGVPGAPPMPGAPPGAAPAPAPGAPMPPAPGAAAPDMAAAAPAAGATTEVALKPSPIERWRGDPFAPSTPPKGGQRQVRLQPKLTDFPMLARIFPPPPPPIEEIEQLLPQPPRRVAGILYSDRVNALIQTPDGWETVKPGDRLRDGTHVERIERDRVILRTADNRPRLIEVKLAATVTPIQEKQNVPAADTGRGAFRGGPPMPGAPGMPPGRPM